MSLAELFAPITKSVVFSPAISTDSADQPPVELVLPKMGLGEQDRQQHGK
jgi:hypothetical protein